MKTILLADEAVTLIRQLGATTAPQLHYHLPQHTEDDVAAALRSAAGAGRLTEMADGAYAYGRPQESDEDETSTIVSQALRARTALELGWCGALAL